MTLQAKAQCHKSLKPGDLALFSGSFVHALSGMEDEKANVVVTKIEVVAEHYCDYNIAYITELTHITGVYCEHSGCEHSMSVHCKTCEHNQGKKEH